MAVKAIETEYRGFLFRSRLEARWAIFFDALGIPWAYEKEGYDLDGTWYLPDFWLPQQDCWVEIKGQEPTGEEFQKGHHLAVLTDKDLFICSGEIRFPDEFGDYDGHYLCDKGMWEPHERYDDQGNLSLEVRESIKGVISCSDYAYHWCECPHCHKVGLEFEARAARLCDCDSGDRGHNGESPRLLRAYAEARRARFEHRQKDNNLLNRPPKRSNRWK